MRPRKIQLRSTKAIRALLLATVMSLGFAACADKDDATTQNPLGDKIVGTFFQLYHATGTVDLSLYRPDGIDFEKDKMKLQMYSWDKHDVSLFSTMEADIDGTIKALLNNINYIDVDS